MCVEEAQLYGSAKSLFFSLDPGRSPDLSRTPDPGRGPGSGGSPVRSLSVPPSPRLVAPLLTVLNSFLFSQTEISVDIDLNFFCSYVFLSRIL
jgi:hypothetical protein